MIEDPNFTRDILEFFARDEISFPANIQVEDLQREFPDKDLPVIEYHVMCALDSELLMGDYSETRTFDGVIVMIGYINGLTPRGGDYVRDSRTEFWERAWKRIRDSGLAVTTDRLIQVLAKLAEAAL